MFTSGCEVLLKQMSLNAFDSAAIMEMNLKGCCSFKMRTTWRYSRACIPYRSRKFERSYLIGGLLGRLGIMNSETLVVPEKGYTSSHNSCFTHLVKSEGWKIKRSKDMYLMIYLENLEQEYENQKYMLETEVTKYFNKGMEVEAQEMRTKVAVVMRVDNRVKRMKLPRTPPISQVDMDEHMDEHDMVGQNIVEHDMNEQDMNEQPEPQPQTSSLTLLLYHPFFISQIHNYDVMIGIARLKFCYLSMPYFFSSVVAYVSAAFPFIDSLKNWNDRFFWVDAFAYLASFPWSTSKSVPKDPYPKSSAFNTEHYATLVAYPAPFHKYPEPFLCLMGISHYYTLDENTYPEFLRDDDEGGCLFIMIFVILGFDVEQGMSREDETMTVCFTTIGREEQSGAAGGSQSVSIQFLGEGAEVVAKEVASLQPRQKKRQKTVVDDVEPSYLAKRLRDDHEVPGGPTVGEVRGGPAPTFPFVTSFVSAMPERKEGDHVDSLAGASLRTIGAPQRFIIFSDSSFCSGTHVADTEVDSFIRFSAPAMTTATTVTETAGDATVVKETVTKPSLFATASSSADGTEPTLGGFSDLTGSDLLVGDIRTIIDPDSDLQKVYVPQ
ncbi:hypothetical protein Tco_1066556 [Tanacetum coccineum]|uniref:Uncharacterized protein n=1 Tax=Tanacetum coccineum TaxID=301880 RepID=A0ABQ5HBN0_9ASTR